MSIFVHQIHTKNTGKSMMSTVASAPALVTRGPGVGAVLSTGTTSVPVRRATTEQAPLAIASVSIYTYPTY